MSGDESFQFGSLGTGSGFGSDYLKESSGRAELNSGADVVSPSGTLFSASSTRSGGELKLDMD